MPTYSLEEAQELKKLTEALTGNEYQIVPFWGKKGTYYVREKPKVKTGRR